MTDTLNLLALTQAATNFAQTTLDVTRHRELLKLGYHAWRESTGNTFTDIDRNDANWVAMLQATADQYRELQNAKGRERRAKAKLVKLVNRMGATQ